MSDYKIYVSNQLGSPASGDFAAGRPADASPRRQVSNQLGSPASGDVSALVFCSKI